MYKDIDVSAYMGCLICIYIEKDAEPLFYLHVEMINTLSKMLLI